MRTIAIGLDGCSWNVLEPLLETGELPNLAALRTNGAQGILESTIPFYTGPAWASFATGASPAGHGIYDFMMLREDGRLSVARQSDLRRITYHEQLGREGKRAVLVNLPIDQHGCDGAVIVNSWLTDDPHRRILPVGRQDRYRRLLEAYKTFPQNPRDVNELCRIEEARFDLARELFLGEEWDHFFILFSSTDWLGHGLTGAFLDGDEEAMRTFLRLYRQLDQYIGWLVGHAPDALVTVLSDHGQTAETAVVRINTILRHLGHVQPVEPGSAEASPFFVDRRAKPKMIRVPTVLSRHRYNGFVRPLAMLAKRSLRKGLGVQLTSASARVDRVASRAFTPTDSSFAVYVNGVTDEELAGIREALADVKLDDGRPALEGIWSPEELYGREPVAGDPALLFSPALGVRPSAALKEPAVHPQAGRGRGCHQRDGIVLLGGAAVAGGIDLGRVSICDVAPTLLWAMGSGIPDEADGRVLFEAFEPSFADSREIVQVDASVNGRVPMADGDASGEITKRLKALGYI
jgi:predicted AlkP superfamily phosphohydrolase/phosphomutase